MSTDREEARSEKRARRSTRVGILTLVLLAVIGAAVVWGIYRWTEDDDVTGPSVYSPDTPAVVMADALGQIAA
jgi:ABC-type transporter Mla subunit MlaD